MDGKTVRGARVRGDAGTSAPHLVAAFDHAAGTVLGQLAVAATSNEIPTVRTLLDSNHVDQHQTPFIYLPFYLPLYPPLLPPPTLTLLLFSPPATTSRRTRRGPYAGRRSAEHRRSSAVAWPGRHRRSAGRRRRWRVSARCRPPPPDAEVRASDVATHASPRVRLGDRPEASQARVAWSAPRVIRVAGADSTARMRRVRAAGGSRQTTTRKRSPTPYERHRRRPTLSPSCVSRTRLFDFGQIITRICLTLTQHEHSPGRDDARWNTASPTGRISGTTQIRHFKELVPVTRPLSRLPALATADPARSESHKSSTRVLLTHYCSGGHSSSGVTARKAARREVEYARLSRCAREPVGSSVTEATRCTSGVRGCALASCCSGDAHETTDAVHWLICRRRLFRKGRRQDSRQVVIGRNRR